MFVPNEIKKMHREFAKRGKKLYIVGGAIRDYILGKKPKDYDLVTDALPDESEQILNSLGMPSIEVGKKFAVIHTKDYEVATFRKDIGKGRRPDSVEFSTMEEDAKRRDLTINALFYDIGEKKVIDLVGGVEDLLNKRIRTVGNPDDRFSEDTLRKLRALRFVSRIGGELDKATFDSIKRDNSLTDTSKERIRNEFVASILSAKDVSKYLKLLEEFDYFKIIFPDFMISKDFVDEKDYIVLMAILFRENKPDNVLLTKLKRVYFTDHEAKQIKFLISMIDFKPDDLLIRKKQQNVTDEQLAKFGKHIGKNFNKFIKFKPSVSIDEVPKDLKGKDIGDWILTKEKEKFSMINELKRNIKSKIWDFLLENGKLNDIEIIKEDLNKISKQSAIDKEFFGPVYHGTTPDRFDKIDAEGFRIFIDDSMTNNVRHGYINTIYGDTGIPAPVHHLGFGVYFTTVKSIFKRYNLDSKKNMREYYLDVPRLKIINFASQKNMMKWWVENGYNPELAKTDRIKATLNLTNALKEKYDAVWFKGKSMYKLLDGDQIVVFDPNRIYQVDKKLSSEKEIGSKVKATRDKFDRAGNLYIKQGSIGVIERREPTPPNVSWAGDSKYIYRVKFRTGGQKYNILDDDIEPLK